jgi:hypothetical protein
MPRYWTAAALSEGGVPEPLAGLAALERLGGVRPSAVVYGGGWHGRADRLARFQHAVPSPLNQSELPLRLITVRTVDYTASFTDSSLVRGTDIT